MKMQAGIGRTNSASNPRLNFYDHRLEQGKNLARTLNAKSEARGLKRQLERMLPSGRQLASHTQRNQNSKSSLFPGQTQTRYIRTEESELTNPEIRQAETFAMRKKQFDKKIGLGRSDDGLVSVQKQKNIGSLFQHIDPKTNFIFLKTSVSKSLLHRPGNFAGKNIVSFLEKIGEEKKAAPSPNFHKVSIVRAVHDYTIYNPNEVQAPADVGEIIPVPKSEHRQHQNFRASWNTEFTQKMGKFNSDTKLLKQMKSIVNSPQIKLAHQQPLMKTEHKNHRTKSLFNNTQKSVSFVEHTQVEVAQKLDNYERVESQQPRGQSARSDKGSLQLSTQRIAPSSSAIKSLKNRIIKRLNDEKVVIKSSRRPKGHTSFFQQTSLRNFLDKTCDMKSGYISKKILEDQVSKPSVRLQMRSFFESKIDEQSQASMQATQRLHIGSSLFKNEIIVEEPVERASHTERARHSNLFASQPVLHSLPGAFSEKKLTSLSQHRRQNSQLYQLSLA